MSDAATGPHAGLPLLSGPAPDHPDVSEDNCRRCKKGLNAIFSRRRKCNHCGYIYCQSCTDYTALMPRSASHDLFVQSGPGHDIVQVCAFCIRYLNITTKGKDQLKKESLATLKEYASAYRIPVIGVVEKDDLVDRLISARDRGCLKPQHEDFYRKHSVPGQSEPRRGFFSRAAGATSGPSQSQQQQRPPYQPRARTASHPNTFPRPDLAPDVPPEPRPQQQRPSSQYSYTTPPRNPQYAPPPGPPPPPRYNPPPGAPPGMPHFTSRTGAAAQSSANLGVPNTNNTTRQRSSSVPRHTPAASPRPTSPTPAIPTLDTLMDMSSDEISGLSIGTLKAILFRNHVNAGSVLEKGDLVTKVITLIADERMERADAIRRAEEEEREMWAMRERAAEREREERERRDLVQAQEAAIAAQSEQQASMAIDAGEQGSSSASQDNHVSPPTPPPGDTKPKPPPSPSEKIQAKTMAAHLERTGLCVICQDEEANIAIVDCGHLALCRACSDLVMSSTRECPLCRTRIVTEARLLRIFKS